MFQELQNYAAPLSVSTREAPAQKQIFCSPTATLPKYTPFMHIISQVTCSFNLLQAYFPAIQHRPQFPQGQLLGKFLGFVLPPVVRPFSLVLRTVFQATRQKVWLVAPPCHVPFGLFSSSGQVAPGPRWPWALRFCFFISGPDWWLGGYGDLGYLSGCVVWRVGRLRSQHSEPPIRGGAEKPSFQQWKSTFW